MIAIELMGFIGGLATVAIVMLLASTLRGGGDILVLVLAGIVVGALSTLYGIPLMIEDTATGRRVVGPRV